ncbi:DNA polymerase III subunit gamma/tau [Candidatus Schneideria nysicola]|uniref:DNA polymerase III subunit gamma/tau n=1 Tax=Candidatus Schneideria nysicola TaxID=1081631 RepID=UPI001CAA4A66|nr:DNA polymerase III subunit gamma/tau [Candidatus Schneideria nysicola]UAJ65301.1 DNA polymerase III subunit gamma/tau [Candidatus Schneideria nysicola]
MNLQQYVLARKWRPKTFKDIVGQHHIITALTNSLLFNRIHHAYLFSGTRGIGKTTIARVFTKGLNCKTSLTSPCGQCINCCDIEKGKFADLIEIDAASKTKVEDIHELLDSVQYAPIRGRFKVYLIDEVHMLSKYSFNALLKNLEEPPIHVKFILATTDIKKIPITVLSRCLQFHLKILDTQQIHTHLRYILREEQIQYEEEALYLLSKSAQGSMRDALSLTDQAIVMGNNTVNTKIVQLILGSLGIDNSLRLIELLIKADIKTLLSEIKKYANDGVDWDYLLVEILSVIHLIAIAQVSWSQLILYEKQKDRLKKLYKLSKCITSMELQYYYNIFLIGRKELPYAPNYHIGMEMILLRALLKREPNNEIIPPLPSSISSRSSESESNIKDLAIEEDKNIYSYDRFSSISDTTDEKKQIQKSMNSFPTSKINRNNPRDFIIKTNDFSLPNTINLIEEKKMESSYKQCTPLKKEDTLNIRSISKSISRILQVRKTLKNYREEEQNIKKNQVDINWNEEKKLEENLIHRISSINKNIATK